MHRSIPITVLAVMLALPGSAQAHVRLTPATATPGSDALFTITSPNESKQPLTGLRLTVPAQLLVEGAADTAGFTTDVVRDQAGRAVTLSWQGGSVPAGGLALFQFSATMPDHPQTIHLTAVQTFADGSTRLWHSPLIEVADPPSSSDTTARLLAGFGVALGAAAVAIALVEMRRRRI
jgi:uncharacterized protein YcnI